MFDFADADKDGKINWLEFQTMINPPQNGDKRTEYEVVKTERQETESEIKVSLHPQTLSVRGILKQSDSARKNQIAPLEISDTHISTSWSEIGLPEPASNRDRVTRYSYQ